MEPWQLIALSLLGLIAGALNVVAGGGSLLTLPAMIMMDMPGPIANGTNRVAILAQNITAVGGFRRLGFSDFKLSLTLSLCALPGAVAGAWIGTLVRGALFNRILAVIMIALLLQMMWQGNRKRRRAHLPKREEPAAPPPPRLFLGHVCMVGIGLYGGFIQAGVGFMLMAVLNNVLQLDLVRVNMHKVFIVGTYTAAALIVFVLAGDVWWIPGLALAAGNSAGAWVGSLLSVRKGEGFIRRALYLALTAMALRLLWP